MHERSAVSPEADLLSAKPVGSAKHVGRYLPYRPPVALYDEIFRLFALEMVRPPAGTVQLAFRRCWLAGANTLL